MRTRNSYNTLRQFSTATDCLVCPSEPGLGAIAEAINNHVCTCMSACLGRIPGQSMAIRDITPTESRIGTSKVAAHIDESQCFDTTKHIKEDS